MTTQAMTKIDYQRMLDEDVLRFITDTESYFSNAERDGDISVRRACYNAMSDNMRGPAHETVTIHDINSPVPMRVYTPNGASEATEIFYMHGGGFVVGNLETHDDICADIAAETGFCVTAVDYRLAPEHVYPACRDDCCDALRYCSEQSDRSFILMGDSAGGYLAAATALEVRNRGESDLLARLCGLVGIYPVYGNDREAPSYSLHANAPMLTTAGMEIYSNLLFGGDNQAAHAAAPLSADDLSGMPPSVSFSAQCDPLADDGPLFAKRLEDAGCKASCIIDMGLVHAHLRARHSVERARHSFERVINACKSLSRGDWPLQL